MSFKRRQRWAFKTFKDDTLFILPVYCATFSSFPWLYHLWPFLLVLCRKLFREMYCDVDSSIILDVFFSNQCCLLPCQSLLPIFAFPMFLESAIQISPWFWILIDLCPNLYLFKLKQVLLKYTDVVFRYLVIVL